MNTLCKCGLDMDKAKRGKKVYYWINYRLPDGTQRHQPVGFSIEDTRSADAGRKTRKENKLEDILDIQAEGKMIFNELTKWYVGLEKTRCEAEGISSFRRKQDCLNNFHVVFGDTILRDVTLTDFENHKLKRQNEGISKRTIDYDLGEAKRLIKTAWNSNKVSGITWLVFDSVKKLLKTGVNVRKRVMELEEYVTLDQNLPKHLKPLCELALYTGMRPGEMIAINCDMTNRKLPARIIHEYASRDREDGRSTWQPQELESEAYLSSTPQDSRSEDDRKDGHIHGRSSRFVNNPD